MKLRITHRPDDGKEEGKNEGGATTSKPSVTKEMIHDAFAQWDVDNDGYIEAQDVEKVLTTMNNGVGPSKEDVANLIQAMDLNEDGKVSRAEFEEGYLRKLHARHTEHPSDAVFDLQESLRVKR